MLGLLLWMFLALSLAAMMVRIGMTLEWSGFLPFLVAIVLVVPVGFLVAGARALVRYWRAWPEQRMYQRLRSRKALRCQARIVAQEELLPGVFKLVYPLLRLSLDVEGRRTFIEVLIQPELHSRFGPGQVVAVLGDLHEPTRCALDREQVVLQLRPVFTSYGD